jgi:hypothetical protein
MNPYTLEPVYVPRTPEEKAMQRAMLQYFLPQNQRLVIKGLRMAGRTDLIGTGPNCLVPPLRDEKEKPRSGKPAGKAPARQQASGGRGRQAAQKPVQKPAQRSTGRSRRKG